jgi:hypothetical protein
VVAENSAETGAVALAVERLTERVRTNESDDADVSAITVNVGDLRAVLRALSGPLAVEYQSPTGTSLTHCCCDRTAARLVACPVHGDPTIPPGSTTGGEDRG